MKKLNLLYVLLFLTSCMENSSSPRPQDLVQDPVYKKQIEEIDAERFKEDRESFEELLRQNRITREDNGTVPIIVEIQEHEVNVDAPIQVDENGDEIIVPIHDGQQVEEYFVKSYKEQKTEVDEPVVVEPIVIEPKVTDSEASEELVEEPVLDKPIILEEPVKENKIEVDLSPVTGDEPATPAPMVVEEGKPALVVKEEPVTIRPVSEDKSEKEQAVDDSVVDKSVVDGAKDKDEEVANTDEDHAKLPTENIPVPSIRPKMRPENLKAPYKADWDGRSVGKKYTRYALEAIEKYGKNLLDPDVKMEKHRRYCKSYNVLEEDERKRFWLMMISGLSRLESGFRTHTKFTEGFKVSSTSDANVISRGLMQMSIDSIKSRKYKCHTRLGIKSTKDLHDPRKNLACAVIVMNHWVQKDKKLYGFSWRKCKDGSSGCRTWHGVGRYWGPIRIERYERKNMTKSQRVRQEERKDLGRKTNELSFCR